MVEPSPSPVARAVWGGLGFLAVGIGALGVVLPLLPTTGPFILAAWCFSRSNPRFEAWVLGLPGVGKMVGDYRSGMGMPRKSKVWAIGMLTVAVSLSAWRVGLPVAPFVLGTGAIGIYWILVRVPTTETVLAEAEPPADHR